MNDDELRDRVRRAIDDIYRPAPALVRRCADAVARGRARRVRAGLAGGLVTLAAAGALVAGFVVHERNRESVAPVPSNPAVPGGGHLLFALTATNRVVALDPASGRLQWQSGAGSAPPALPLPAARMQLRPDGRMLYVLAPTDAFGGTVIRAYDTRDGHSGQTITLGAPNGPEYSTLAVQPGSGYIFAVGKDGPRIVVTVVDPARQAVLATQVLRQLPTTGLLPGDFASRAAFTGDGTRLYFSYGTANSDVSGIDWMDVSGTTLRTCRRATAVAACLPGLTAGFALDGNHVLFTDATDRPELIEADANGAKLHHTATQLAAGLTSVVLDRRAGTVIILAECDSLGGLTSIDQTTGAVHPLASPAPSGAEPGAETPCGVRPALLADGMLVASRLEAAAAQPNVPGALDIIDPSTGAVRRTITLRAEAQDLLAG